MRDLSSIFDRSQMAVVWVTHDRDEALAVADVVSFLEDGRVTQSGRATDVFGHPSTTSFAAFLGLDAYLEGAVVNGADGLTRLFMPGGLELVCGDAADGPAVACLPPEDVVLFTRPPEAHSASLRNLLPGRVREVRPSGRLLLVSVAAGEIEVAALVTRAAFDDLGLAVGSEVIAAFKASAVHPIPRYERHPPSPEVRATSGGRVAWRGFLAHSSRRASRASAPRPTGGAGATRRRAAAPEGERSRSRLPSPLSL